MEAKTIIAIVLVVFIVGAAVSGEASYHNDDCCISHNDICRMLSDESTSCPRNRFIGIWSCGSFRHLLCRSKN